MLFSLLFIPYFWKVDEIFEFNIPKLPRKDSIAAFTTVGTLWMQFGMHMGQFTQLMRRGMRPTQFGRPFCPHTSNCMQNIMALYKGESHNDKGPFTRK